MPRLYLKHDPNGRQRNKKIEGCEHKVVLVGNFSESDWRDLGPDRALQKEETQLAGCLRHVRDRSWEIEGPMIL